MIRRLTERQLFTAAFDEATAGSRRLLAFLDQPTPQRARRLSIAELADAKAALVSPCRPAVNAVVDYELARRAAWATPARWSVVIAALALFVSFLALVVAGFSAGFWRRAASFFL